MLARQLFPVLLLALFSGARADISLRPSSAPVPINIRRASIPIPRQPPPALAVREKLDFGTVRPGSTATREIVLQNYGGGILKGVASTGGPWSIINKAAYRLRPGETQVLKLRFAPASDGSYSGEVDYSSDPGRITTTLVATVEPPLAITPEHLDLQPGPGGSRVGTLTIANSTEAAISLRLQYSGKLEGPERAEVPAGGTASISVQVDSGQLNAIDGAVQIEAPAFVADIPIHAPAAGPMLRVDAQSLSFGNVDGPNPPAKSVTVANSGGTGCFVRVETPSGMLLRAADTSFWLEAGESRDISLSVAPADAGSYHANLVVKTDTAAIQIPVTAEITHPRTNAVTVSTLAARSLPLPPFDFPSLASALKEPHFATPPPARAASVKPHPGSRTPLVCTIMLLLGAAAWSWKKRPRPPLSEKSLDATPEDVQIGNSPHGPFIRELGPGSFEVSFDDEEAARRLEQR